jgi:hypothetical protein
MYYFRPRTLLPSASYTSTVRPHTLHPQLLVEEELCYLLEKEKETEKKEKETETHTQQQHMQQMLSHSQQQQHLLQNTQQHHQRAGSVKHKKHPQKQERELQQRCNKLCNNAKTTSELQQPGSGEGVTLRGGGGQSQHKPH